MPLPVLPVSSLSPTAAVCLAQAAAPPAERPPLPFQLLPLVAIAAAAYLLLFRPERERLRRQQSMLAGLKKNDRVVTSSGIYGTVASVDAGVDRVVLRVDESANVKLTVTLASIARILGDGGEAAEPKPS
jgi:preprotein translocase subunit YajC